DARYVPGDIAGPDIDCAKRLRVGLTRRRIRRASHESSSCLPFHRALRKHIAALQRREVVQARCRIEGCRIPVRATLKAGTHVSLALSVFFKIVEDRTTLSVESLRPIEILQELLPQQKLTIRAIEHVKESVPIRLDQQLARLPLPLRVDENGRFL